MNSQLVKKLLRRSGYAILALVALLAVFILEENLRGNIQLARYQSKLRAKGEKLTLAEIDLPKIPNEGNGAPALLEAANQLAPLSKTNHLWESGLKMMSFFAPGRARVLHREEVPADWIKWPAHPSDKRRYRSSNEFEEYLTYSWDDLSEQIAAVSNILDRARTATQQPTLAVELDYTKNQRDLPLHSMDILYLRNWLAAAAIDALHHGKLDAASDNIVAMTGLMRLQKSERVGHAQRSRLRTGVDALKVTWEALQAEGWTDPQLARLQESWQHAECLPDYVPTMEMDRVTSLQYYHRDTLKDLRDGVEFVSYYNDDLKQGFDYRLDMSLLTAHWLIWRAAWFEQDQLLCLRRWSKTLEGTRAVIKQGSWTAWSWKPEKYWIPFYDRWRYMVSSRSYGGEFETGQAVRYETLREMAITAIALKRFHLHTGTFPASLSLLVPEFLPELPHDWMDGKPLRYKLNGNGSFTLYSVGDNGVDDGGAPNPSPVSWYLDNWGDRDEVWPVAATREEIEARDKARELKWATYQEMRRRGQVKEPK